MKHKLKKTKWCHYLLSTFLATILVVSCRKIDSLHSTNVDKANKFFSIPSNTNQTILRVATELKKQNALTGFIGDFASKEGYAIWDKAIMQTQSGNIAKSQISTSSNDTVVVVPLVLDNTNYVNSYIMAKLGDSITLRLFRGSDYDLYTFRQTSGDTMNASKYVSKMMLLDNLVFGHKNFKIKDNRLFGDSFPPNITDTSRKIKIWDNSNIGNSASRSTIGVCYLVKKPIRDCTCPDKTNCDWDNFNGIPNNPCPSCSEIKCFTYDLGDGGGTGNEGGYDNSFGPPENGGGGNNNPPPNNPPCHPGGFIDNGRLPCDPHSGGGSGGLGWEPVEDEPQPTETDPCPKAKEAAKKMDSLFTKSKADSALAAIPNLATGTLERGFPIYKDIRINPYNVHDTITKGYSVGALQTGGPTGVTISSNPTMNQQILVSTLHTHPPIGYTAQSVADIYSLIGENISNYNFQGTFVGAFNGSQYAITVTNPAQAAAFYSTMGQYLNTSNNLWNDTTAIGIAYTAAYEHFKEKFDGNPNKLNLANEMAMAAVIGKFNIGITLAKKNSAGEFKPIVVSTSVIPPTRPRKPAKTVYTQECL
jgi:hypothetical protein